VTVVDGARSPSAASVDVAFTGFAGADGIRLQVIVPGGPVTANLVDGGGPVAEAALGSSGDAQGFAAFPFPGDTAMGGAGLAAGALAGAGVRLPPEVPTRYPLSVLADSNAPEQEVGSGPFALRARTNGTDAAEAQAITGVTADGKDGLGIVSSAASLTRTAGEVTALAESRTRGIQIGPLALAHVTGTAKVILLPDGTATPSSSLEIGGASVSGTPVASAPGGPEEMVKALNAALAPTKMQVHYLAAQEIPGGLVSGVLSITAAFPTGGSDGTFRVLLGRASAVIRTEQSEAAIVEPPAPAQTEAVAEAAAPAVPFGAAAAAVAAPLTVSPARRTAPALSAVAGLSRADMVATPAGTQPGLTGVDPAVKAASPATDAALVAPKAGREVALPLQPASTGRLTFGSAYVALALMVVAGAAASQVVRRTGRNLT
jgi:hypothetical protein